ncbi:MAG: 50S ribosomal protein L11 methyltransferase [Myxococcota bacterium]
MAAVRRGVEGRLAERARVGPASPVAEQDWSRGWRAHHRPLEISPRLAIQPSFARAPVRPGQEVLVIDPGQAFGTGSHASTRLILELLAGPLCRLLPGSEVLDAGTGSGVLALAALRLGARRVVAFDLDPLAAAEARRNALGNGLAAGLQLFTGPAQALRGSFDLVVANLLRGELEPILPTLTEQLGSSGALVLSGLLEAEEAPVRAALAELGLLRVEARRSGDATGDRWLALMARRAPGPASRR